MRRRSKLLLGGAIVLLFALGWFVHDRREKRDTAARNLIYQQHLAEFTHVIRPGMTRDRVEAYVRSRGMKVKQLCCVATHRGEDIEFQSAGWDDLVKIGEEPVPFVCREHNVYVAFEFNPKGPDETSGTNASDILKNVSVFKYLEYCL